MRRETELFFESVLEEDRSLLEFIDSKYTFVNPRLAKHYGLEGVDEGPFQRVVLPKSDRGGILTHASILATTSNPTRTSPVKRGKWVLENLLGDAPPPPPPMVKELDDSPAAALQGSLRQRTEQHHVDDAEERSVQPDAHRERGDCDDGEDRIAGQRPAGVLDLLAHISAAR